MKTIPELLARAAALRDETALNSISPDRAGGIMYDTLLALNELWLQQGAALVISKIYASVAAMEADTAPVSDLTGKPLRPGQIVVIASSDSDNGSVYRYNGTESPSWSLVGSIGNLDIVDSLDSDSTTLPLAAHQGKVLDGKIRQLSQKVDEFAQGKFYGYFTNAEDLPTEETETGFAYVGAAAPFAVYNYNGTEWIDSGVTVDRIPAGNGEDIDYNAKGLLQFADRHTAVNQMGYVILRKNKTFAEQVTDANTIYEIRYSFSVTGDVTIPSGCELRFIGGSISGSGNVIGTGTYINATDKCFGKNLTISGTWANETVFTRWFEFVSSDDGVTDNSLCFKQLQSVINGTSGCRVEFENGIYQTQIIGNEPEGYVEVSGVTYPKWAMNTYQVDRRVVLNIFELPYVDINLNGSTIKAINITCPGWEMIRLNGVQHGSIHDGTIIGMANGFEYPQYVNYSGSVVNDYEFSILLYQSGGTCEVRNIECKYSTGDGINVGSSGWYFRSGDVRPSGVVPSSVFVPFPAEGYTVANCEVSYCGRNGITLHSSEEGKLENCHIHHIGSDAGSGNIGSDGIQGRSPRAGIDVEFEDGQGLKPILLWENLYIHNCGGKSYGFATPSLSRMKQFSARNCRFIRMGVNNNLVADGPKEFINCYFEHDGGEGSLYGDGIIYRNCRIVLKYYGFNIGASVFDNCEITDEIPDDVIGTNMVFSQGNNKTIFWNSTLTIKHRYGYLQDKTFHNCVLNFYSNSQIPSTGIECYNCEFHNNPEDTSNYSFQFIYGNNSGTTRGHFWFYNCTFEKLRGYGSSVSSYALYSDKYPVVLDNCSISKTFAFYHGSGLQDITVRNCRIAKLYVNKYQQDASGVKPTVIDNCVIDDIYVGLGSIMATEISNSKVCIATNDNYKLQYVNFTKCEVINNTTRASWARDAGVNAVDTIFDFVVSEDTSSFNLVNCYVKGVVTEASFAGTKKNCTFETPFAKSGATADRPTASAVGAGFTYFDTDLGKMIVSNGTAWVNMDGSALS